MKKCMLMMGVMSAGVCFAGDFAPVQPRVVPQQIVVLALAAQVALGNNPRPIRRGNDLWKDKFLQKKQFEQSKNRSMHKKSSVKRPYR